MKHCYWWSRWWHRRLRRLDREFLWPALGARMDAIALHMDLPGNEHWRCECAALEAGCDPQVGNDRR